MRGYGLIPVLLRGLCSPATSGPPQADLAPRSMQGLHGAGADLESAAPPLAVVEPVEVPLDVGNQCVEPLLPSLDHVLQWEKHLVEEALACAFGRGLPLFVRGPVRPFSETLSAPPIADPQRLASTADHTLGVALWYGSNTSTAVGNRGRMCSAIQSRPSVSRATWATTPSRNHQDACLRRVAPPFAPN